MSTKSTIPLSYVDEFNVPRMLWMNMSQFCSAAAESNRAYTFNVGSSACSAANDVNFRTIKLLSTSL